MGSCTSRVAPNPNALAAWKAALSSEEAREKYEKDGSLPKNAAPGLLELRAFLDDPHLMQKLGQYAIGTEHIDIFMCWVEVQEYKGINPETIDFQRGKALHIYNKYMKHGSELYVD